MEKRKREIGVTSEAGREGEEKEHAWIKRTGEKEKNVRERREKEEGRRSRGEKAEDKEGGGRRRRGERCKD